MERKIGEIFEYNGEWYQCVESQDGSCKHCDMNFEGKCPMPIKECTESGRSDKSYVIFKKLEKVGEPYSDYCPSGRVIYFQRYGCFQKPIYNGDFIYWSDDISISIEIKQNKEDMEEKELTYEELLHYYHSTIGLWAIDRNPQEVHFDWICKNAFQLGMDKILSNSENIGKNLKPFDLQAAKSGKPVCTRSGRKARIICFDRKDNTPIVALIESVNHAEILQCVHNNGKCFHYDTSNNDLMMLSEKKEGWVNVYRDCDGANITKDDNIYSSKDAAIASAQIIDRDNYVATTIIKWEE